MTFVTAIQSESADLSTAVLADLSTYTTPARDALALYLYLYKRDATLADTAITITNNDPLNVTEWSFTLAGDGWYRAILFGFPIWIAGTYGADECVYHSGSYYKANTTTSGTPGASANWDLITDILAEVLNLADSGVEITQTNNFTTVFAEVNVAGDSLQDLGPKIRAGKCKDINDAAKVLLIEGLIDSAWMNFERGDNVEAQNIIDFVNTQMAA